MGLNLSRPTPSQPQPSQGQAPAAQEEESYQQYDISADRQMMTQTLVNSPEVDALASQIEVYNLESIVSFGAGAADEISKCSDVVLNSMNLSQLDDSSAMLNTLAKIMDKFDIEEIKENPGLFGKLFGNLRKQLDKILAKYHTMGDEVDKIYVQLKQYEADIKQSNRKLEEMFQANVNYYHELVRYILAGEQGCRELEAYIAQRQADMEATGDNSIQFELTTLNQALMMLEQRTQDLRTAENVAMQSIPMIKTMQFSNMNLVRKINSAFIITLPVFKQALTQAIMLKRQRLQTEAMSALDAKTNEMLIRNAQNTAEQAKMTARLASGSSIKIETLEQTWHHRQRYRRDEADPGERPQAAGGGPKATGGHQGPVRPDVSHAGQGVRESLNIGNGGNHYADQSFQGTKSRPDQGQPRPHQDHGGPGLGRERL